MNASDPFSPAPGTRLAPLCASGAAKLLQYQRNAAKGVSHLMWGKGDRVVDGRNKRAIVMERMPDEAVEKGFTLGERFGGEQMPTIHQCYTTGGAPYTEFHAPDDVDDFELYRAQH